VKDVLAGMISLSATVTSVTKAALLTQSAGLVGMRGCVVGVSLACAVGVSVPSGALVAVGVSVVAAAWVFVWVDAAVSTGACAPQADIISTRKIRVTGKFFLIKTSFLFLNGGGEQFHYIHKSSKKSTFSGLEVEFEMQCKITFMREDTLLQQAMSAVRAGHEMTARDIFLEVLEVNPRNETAWIWLTGLLDDPDDCIYACEQVLEINPNNDGVNQYLSQLRVEKKKRLEEKRLFIEQQVRRARELVKAKKSDEALELIRSMAQSGDVNADVWRMLADLSSDMDEQLSAFEKFLALRPGDIHARQEFERLRHFKNNPLDLAAMYEEQGNIGKAIETYSIASLKARSKSEQDSIYWKTVRLENMRYEKIAHVPPAVSIARLTAGPPLLYFMLLLVHVGLRPITNSELLLWFGFFWVLLGGFMIALASVRSHHRLWLLIFKDAGSGGTPTARTSMAVAGWILVFMPFAILFLIAFGRLKAYLYFP
jgi:tetratricopeptide (TPR) repeat protein